MIATLSGANSGQPGNKESLGNKMAHGPLLEMLEQLPSNPEAGEWKGQWNPVLPFKQGVVFVYKNSGQQMVELRS